MRWSEQPDNLTTLATPTNPEVTRLRQQLTGSERARALLLHDITERQRQIVALRRERDALRLLVHRGRIGWWERAICAVIALWDDLRGLRDPNRPLSTHVKLAILALTLACIAIIFKLGA